MRRARAVSGKLVGDSPSYSPSLSISVCLSASSFFHLVVFLITAWNIRLMRFNRKICRCHLGFYCSRWRAARIQLVNQLPPPPNLPSPSSIFHLRQPFQPKNNRRGKHQLIMRRKIHQRFDDNNFYAYFSFFSPKRGRLARTG